MHCRREYFIEITITEYQSSLEELKPKFCLGTDFLFQNEIVFGIPGLSNFLVYILIKRKICILNLSNNKSSIQLGVAKKKYPEIVVFFFFHFHFILMNKCWRYVSSLKSLI